MNTDGLAIPRPVLSPSAQEQAYIAALFAVIDKEAADAERRAAIKQATRPTVDDIKIVDEVLDEVLRRLISKSK